MAEPKKQNRKYVLALISMILCTICYLGTGWNVKLNANYGTFVMAVGMALGLYSGANVADTHVMGMHGALPHQLAAKREEEEVEEEPKP